MTLSVACVVTLIIAHIGDTVINRGRIVVVTALEGDSRYKELLGGVEEQLTQINEEAAQVR